MGRRKRRSALLCNVCQEPRGSSILPNPSCKSHVVTSRHFTCDSCLYKHVFTTISQDITNRVICPEQGCDAKIARDTIKTILCTFRRQDLWEDYRLKSGWRGTSKEWIKKFTARCPQCRVPIEKNGGCDQVVCRQCHFGFNWKLAKTLNLHQIQPLLKTSVSLVRVLLYIFLTIGLLFLFMKLFSLYKEKLMSMVNNLLIYLISLSHMCVKLFSLNKNL
jgi:hypothetical protein